MTIFIGLQITRLSETSNEGGEQWLIRAWHSGHGCDVIVPVLKPPYSTLADDGSLSITDASGKSIASTRWVPRSTGVIEFDEPAVVDGPTAQRVLGVLGSDTPVGVAGRFRGAPRWKTP